MSDEDDELDLPITWPMSMDDMERFIKINMAERAIVEAADAHEKIARYDEHDNAHTHWTYRQLLYTVDAWRKLRDAR